MLKKNLISIVILVALIIISAIYIFSNKNNTLSNKEAAFACNDLYKVTSINIKNKDSSFILTRKGISWYYNSKFVVKPSLMSLCYKIFSQIEIKSPVSKKISGLVANKLRQSGTEIKLSNENKILKHYIVWADSQNKDIYMMMSNSHVPYNVTLPSIQGNFAALFQIDPEFWRDLTIIHYTPDQIASVKVDQPGNLNQSFYLEISSKGKAILTSLKSGKLQNFNKEAVEEYLFCFKNVKVAAFIENSSGMIKTLGKKLPLFKVAIIDQEGKVNCFKIFQKEADNKNIRQSKNNFDIDLCYILINERELAIAKYVEIDPITRDLSFFLQK